MTAKDKIGVLLVNLGSPGGTDRRAMRRYLKQFLWDRRVVEIPRPLWWLILNGIILNTRPAKSGEKYRKIWDKKNDCAPLITITRTAAEKLAARFARQSDSLIIDWAMRYGAPSIAERMENLMEQGCSRILVLPLYPQYSASTTATVVDEAGRVLAKMRHQPALRFAPPYFDEPAYIKALSAHMKQALDALDFEPEVILASFHGLPRRFADLGDPYPQHCETTFRLLKEAMGKDGYKLQMTYQSRFGKAEWLQPYTDKTLEQLVANGVKKVAVVTPGFAADCLETLEEIALENAEVFRAAGGEKFALLPCLNDSDEAMTLLVHLIRRELAGWLSLS